MTNMISVLAQNNGPEAAAGMVAAGCGCIMFLLYLAILVVIIAGLWKVFTKAGEPGWAAIIPIYNLYTITKIVDRPWWWLLVCLIPFVGIVGAVFLCIDLARKFGKDAGYGIGILLLGFVFIPMLGFGKAEYQGHGPIKEGFTL